MASWNRRAFVSDQAEFAAEFTARSCVAACGQPSHYVKYDGLCMPVRAIFDKPHRAPILKENDWRPKLP